MAKLRLPSDSLWGYQTPSAAPLEIIRAVAAEACQAISKYAVLPEEREPCGDRDGYFRVSVEIPLSQTLFDQLMNGRTGYRAHYSAGVDVGEDFNRCLIEAVAPIVVNAESLYADRFDRTFCERSLLGDFSKLWYPKRLTDLGSLSYMVKSKEELRIPRWLEYWHARSKPRKGLLAPLPEVPSILFNGTFVNELGDAYEQKPGRSIQLFETGWT